MASQARWYGQGIAHLARKRVDWLSDTVKVALLLGAYTPDQDTHDYFDDVVGNEIDPSMNTGYTAGGATLGGKVVAYDATTNTLQLKASNAVWTPSTSIVARYAVVYVVSGTNATSPLLGYVDFGGNETSDGGDFTIAWATTGVLTATAA